ncbi:hypothetical protein ACSFA7_13130 [Variovorax sp. LT1R20]|uniref:hypothetical protein n=1 Tax=Variovorax sp. LT1R20 TaxID=3443729 RepID=UPI003F474F16
MKIEFTSQEIEMLLTSLKYSKRNIDEGGQEYEIKQKALNAIDRLAAKIRASKEFGNES